MSIDVWLNKRYLLLDKIGEGGMGAVYKVHDRLTGTTVALKRVTTSASDLDFNSRDDSSNLHVALAQEFKTLASLRHPHIISVLDYGFDEHQQPYFTMDYLENAQTITSAASDITFDEKIDFILDMLQALTYLHRRKILHRDLKPDNVLVAGGTVRVMDFGLSLVTKDSSEAVGELAGTIAYMAPELFQGGSVSQAADLYAVGIIAYEMLAGQYPFPQNNIGMLISHILMTDIDVTPVDANLDVVNVLKQLLAKSRDERYANAYDVIRDLCNATDRALPVETEAIRESFLQAAKFVGRKTEMDQLLNIWKEVASGKSQAVLIGGESGVGKSRLLDEFRIHAVVHGALVLRGQSVSEGGASYQLWRDALRILVLQSDLDSEQASILKPLVPNIDKLLGRDVEDAPQLDPQQAQVHLFKTIATICQQQTQPMLFIMEDLQWAGSESLALMDHLSQGLQGTPLLFISTYRDDEAPELPKSYPHMQPMKLHRLDEASIAELSVSILGESGKQAKILELLERESEGNVFFVVEVVRALAEREQLGLQAIANITIPEKIFIGGIRDIIQRRLDRVPENLRLLLQLAAIGGRRLDLEVLQGLYHNNNLEDWLSICTNASILEMKDESWQFAHDKIRDFLLSSISAHQRPDLYQQVAIAIESHYGNSSEQAATLAYLWRVAENFDKELIYSKQAGEQAFGASASVEAANYFERVIELLLEQPKSPQRAEQELVLQTMLGYSLMNIRGYADPDVEKAYRRANELATQAQRSQQLGPILYGLWAFHYSRAELSQTKEHANRLLELGQMLKNDTITLIGHNALAATYFALGEFTQGLQHGEKAVAMADENNDPSLSLLYGGEFKAYSRVWLAMCQCASGLVDQASATHKVALEVATDHPYTLAFILSFGFVPQFLQDFSRIVEQGYQLIDLATQYRFSILGMFGQLYLAQGQSQDINLAPASVKTILEILPVLDMVKLIAFKGFHLTQLAEVYLLMDDYDKATETVTQALNFVEKSGGSRFILPEVHRLQGDIIVKSQTHNVDNKAEQNYLKAISFAQTQHAKLWELRAATSLARLYQSQGKISEAREKLTAVYGWFTAGFDTYDLKAAKALLDELS